MITQEIVSTIDRRCNAIRSLFAVAEMLGTLSRKQQMTVLMLVGKGKKVVAMLPTLSEWKYHDSITQYIAAEYILYAGALKYCTGIDKDMEHELLAGTAIYSTFLRHMQLFIDVDCAAQCLDKEEVEKRLSAIAAFDFKAMEKIHYFIASTMLKTARVDLESHHPELTDRLVQLDDMPNMLG